MTPLIVDAVLLAALVFTAAVMVAVRRRLARLDAEHGRLRSALGELADSLDAAEGAVSDLREDGCALLLALAGRIEEGRALVREIDMRTGPARRGTVASDRRALARGQGAGRTA